MELAYRLDRGGLRSPRKTPQGFLRVDGHATRVGVLEYVDASYPGGVRRELRLPEDLFHFDSLASYEGAPVTDDHPPEMVTATNARTYQRGTSMTQGRRDGDHVAVDLQIVDENLIAKVGNGKVELSNGYQVKLDPTSGVHPLYGRYDCIQRDIRLNHIAVVDVGRAGPTSRIRMDRAELVSCCAQVPAQPAHATPLHSHRGAMPDPTNTSDLQNQLARALELAASEKVRADNATAQVAGLNERADKAEGQVTVLESQVAQLRTERRDDAQIASLQRQITELTERADKAERAALAIPGQIAAGIRARVDIERDAARVLGPDQHFDGLTDREVMLLVLDKRGVAIEGDRTDAMVAGAFKAAVAGFVAHQAAWRDVAAASRPPEPKRQDTAGQSVASARAAMIDRLRRGGVAAAS